MDKLYTGMLLTLLIISTLILESQTGELRGKLTPKKKSATKKRIFGTLPFEPLNGSFLKNQLLKGNQKPTLDGSAPKTLSGSFILKTECNECAPESNIQQIVLQNVRLNMSKLT